LVIGGTRTPFNLAAFANDELSNAFEEVADIVELTGLLIVG
jgi:hypothetical protein